MLKFRLLKADEIEVKVKTIRPNGAVLLLYKTARTDMDLLDETVGPENWDCDYKEIKGNLYCIIGIRFPVEPTGDRWVYKSDCGIESREDSEGNQKKGEASDAFKRAGFKWGIGRELYSAPFIWIAVPDKNDRFKVDKIEYTDRTISDLVISNQKGVVVFDMKKPVQAPKTPQNVPQRPTARPNVDTDPMICVDCGAVINMAVRNYSVQRFGRPLCRDCQKRA